MGRSPEGHGDWLGPPGDGRAMGLGERGRGFSEEEMTGLVYLRDQGKLIFLDPSR